MPVFFAIAATVAVAVILLVLRPLWRQSPVATAAMGVSMLLVAGGLYARLGTPAALDAANLARPATLPDAVAQLEAALQRDPSQAEGWRLLGRAYASQQQPDKARDAFRQAAQRAPDQPDILVEAAEATALADPKRRFDAAAVALLRRALVLQPRHQRARWFLGIAQVQAGHAADAAATWEPLLADVDAATAVPLRAEINVARKEAGLPPLTAPVGTTGAPLRVAVSLDPQLAARVRLDGSASVFVIARLPNGPPMPVAVEKHSVSELPFTATLDDSDGPMPTQRLSAQRQVDVVVRLSASGDAMRQADDIESAPVRVQLPADAAVRVTLGTPPR